MRTPSIGQPGVAPGQSAAVNTPVSQYTSPSIGQSGPGQQVNAPMSQGLSGQPNAMSTQQAGANSNISPETTPTKNKLDLRSGSDNDEEISIQLR